MLDNLKHLLHEAGVGLATVGAILAHAEERAAHGVSHAESILKLAEDRVVDLPRSVVLYLEAEAAKAKAAALAFVDNVEDDLAASVGDLIGTRDDEPTNAVTDDPVIGLIAEYAGRQIPEPAPGFDPATGADFS